MKSIPLTQGKYAIVDDEDYEHLIQWKWYAHKSHNTKDTFYAYRKDSKGKKISMHREIFGLICGDKRQVDHRNTNGLDNKKKNLRLCSHSQNQMNRRVTVCASRYKGVTKLGKKWKARLVLLGARIELGIFNSEREAAHAYNKAAKIYFGEFAKCNLT